MAKRLSELKRGETGVVASLLGTDRTICRLAEMGVTRGARVETIRVAPLGDPIEIVVRGGSLSLRRSEAERVLLMDKHERAAYTRLEQESTRGLLSVGIKRVPKRVRARGVIALIGNPNAGKTTLFNALTGARAYTGNRPGVTIEVREKKLRAGAQTVTLCDLPGVYSLSALSRDERVAADFLVQQAPDAAIYVADATNLARSLFLAMQVMERGIPLVLALNMTDELDKRGLSVDAAVLGKLLGVRTIPICARTGDGLPQLLESLDQTLREPFVSALKQSEAGQDPIASASERYALIDRICASAVRQTKKSQEHTGIDALLTHRVWGVPIFLCVMASIFWLTFDSLGAWLSRGAQAVVSLGTVWLKNALAASSMPAWLTELLCEGVCGGVGAVVTFVPQLAVLFLLLSLLEDSGYLARTAFLMDSALRRIGLSGKSFIPLLLGYGCTVPAAMCARTMERDDARRTTILLLPFASCSAKLPVYGMLTSAFFSRTRGLTLFTLYALGALCGILTGLLLRKTKLSRGREPFLMELPPYRMPTARNTLLHVGERIYHFLSRAGTAILLMSTLLWVLTRFSGAFRPTSDVENSLLADVGRWIAPFLQSLGFGSWQAGVTLVSALAAKEAAVAALTLVSGAGGVGAVFTPASGFAFLVFVLLYTPCVAALAAMRRELGSLWLTLFSAVWQTALAYLISFGAYRFALLLC